ncbi:MAG: hypothetical protein JNM94_06900 [Phycisphaerae bacterium]|nr:hypothetical protein [Phycisphaerae bacterium]
MPTFRTVPLLSFALASSLFAAVAAGLAQDAKPTDTAPPAPATTSADTAGLPDAKTILAKHIGSLGGREKLDAITSASYTGVASTPNGDITLAFATKKPGKLWMRQQIASIGEMVTACDGEEAWAKSVGDGSYVLLDPALREQFRNGADLQALVRDLDRRFSTVKTVGTEKFNGTQCYAVSMREKDGPEIIGLFAIDSGLLQGFRITDTAGPNPMTQVQSFGDWTEVDGVKVFRSLRTDINGLVVQTTFADLAFNKVEDSTFERPAKVKELIAEREKAARTATPPAQGTQPSK